MKVYSISDLHLSINNPKPMNIFGESWDNYWEEIQADWIEKVSEEDLVLISGDISWAMKLQDASPDLIEINKLPGKKVIIRGNHDYWWSSYSKVKEILPHNMYAIQNNAIKFGDFIICGTRGWTVQNPKSTADDIKIINRELIRLQMTLDEAQKMKEKDEQEIILMMHYPPFNAQWQDSQFTDIISKYPVQAVTYGHLHGKNCRTKDIVIKNDIPYILTSCDQVNNKLQLLAEK